MRLVLALSTALALSAPALAQQTPPATGGQGISVPRAAAPLVLSAEQRTALTTAVARGRQLALIDQAARISTQDMLARIANPTEAGIIGWVAEPEGNAMAVTYYARVAAAAGEATTPAPTATPTPTPASTPAETPADSTELAGEAAPSASEITASLGSGQAAAALAPAEASAAEAPVPDENYVTVYRTQVLGGRVVSPQVLTGDARTPLTGAVLRMARARQAVAALNHPPCGRNDNNMLVLPPADDSDPVTVYEIAPRTSANEVPVGGQHRTVVNADGRVGESTQMGGECAVAPIAPVLEGQRPRPVIVNARAATLPNELHVFISLWTGRPVIVATGETRVRLWGVTGEGIGELRDQPATGR